MRIICDQLILTYFKKMLVAVVNSLKEFEYFGKNICNICAILMLEILIQYEGIIAKIK